MSVYIENNSKNQISVLVPTTDIYETENEYNLKMEMPGVPRENLEVTLENNELEIKGRVTEESGKEDKLKYSEYKLLNYYRKFKIGNDVNKDAINASLDNGILTLTLNKSEEVKPKKIEISIN